MSEAIVEIVVILLLILLNGLFAMSEIAIVSARRVRLQQMADEFGPGKGGLVGMGRSDLPGTPGPQGRRPAGAVQLETGNQQRLQDHEH